MNVTLVLACLSPEEIRTSIHIGYYAAAFAISLTCALLLLSWHQRNFAWLPLYASLLLLHPAWTIGANTGDCGYAKRFFSIAASIVLVALLVCQIVRPGMSRLRFLLVLSAVCWAAYLPLFLSFVLHFPLRPGTGFAGELVQSFVLSSNTLLSVAVTLTLIYLVLWLFNRIRTRPAAD